MARATGGREPARRHQAMMTRRRFWMSMAVMGGIVMAAPLPARAQDISKEAASFVQALGSQTIAVVTDKSLSAVDRDQRFHDIFVASFDVPGIARFVLGRYWHSATDAQKVEFQTLFESMIVRTYADRFSQYKGEPFAVVASRKEEGEKHAMVTTSLAQPGNGALPLKIDWRVLEPEGSLKIVDVIIEGVSMILTQQQEFAAVIQRNGGQLESLLATMRTRVQQQRQTSAVSTESPSR
jgi:phospholipid transport system substrate-binding protein